MPKAIRYKPLYDFLKQQSGQFVEISFSQIEEILGFKLPASARKHRAFWSNNVHNAAITHWWLKAGYIATDIDWPGERLTFVFSPDEAMSALKKKEAGSSINTDTPSASSTASSDETHFSHEMKRRIDESLAFKGDVFDLFRGIFRYEGNACATSHAAYVPSDARMANVAPQNILLDTCAFIHLSTGEVGSDVADYMKDNGVGIYVLSILALEMGKMVESRTLISSMPLQYIFEKIEANSFARVVDASYEVFLDSINLPGNPPEDMIERVLIATARRHALAIMTRNKNIISYASQGFVKIVSY